MKPITEEQRQALIDDCNEQIEILKNLIFNGSYDEDNSNLESQLLVQEITLASLTAEPTHYVFNHPNGKLFNALVYESCKGHKDVHPGYTAMPVPVIKPDQLEGLQVSVDVSTCDADSGNRIFGRVSSVTESKGETVLVVEEIERNFNPEPMIDLPKYKSKITADCAADVYFQGKGDGWNECLAEIKRLNRMEE